MLPPGKDFQGAKRPFASLFASEDGHARHDGDEGQIGDRQAPGDVSRGGKDRDELSYIEHHVSELAQAPRCHAPVGKDRSAWYRDGRVIRVLRSRVHPLAWPTGGPGVTHNSQAAYNETVPVLGFTQSRGSRESLGAP